MTTETKVVHSGYKIVDKDLCGYGKFPYIIGATATLKGVLKFSENAIHFCEFAICCLLWMDVTLTSRYLRVEARSDMITEDGRSGTLALYVVEELTLDQFKEQMVKDWEVKREEYGGRRYTNSLLALAAMIGDLPLMQKAINAGARNINGALVDAAKGGQTASIQLLIKNGAFWMYDALITAIEENQQDVIKLIVERAIDVPFALHLATKYKSDYAITLLNAKLPTKS